MTKKQQRLFRKAVIRAMSTLTHREREILEMTYGIADGYVYTLQEIGARMKITRERIRQIRSKALRKLQHPVRARIIARHWADKM